MHRSKLIPVLKSFSKEEIKEFDKFLDSPFFGCKKFVLNFYRAVIKYYPEFREDDISKMKLFGKLYGEKKYDDGLVRRIISDLIRYSEEYMKIKNFKGNSSFQIHCMLNELRKRNLDDSFRIRSESFLKKLNSSENVDPEMLLETYFANLEIKEFRTFARDYRMHEALDKSTEALSVFFLRTIYSYINHKNTFAKETKNDLSLSALFFDNLNINSLSEYFENIDSRYSAYLKMIIYSFNIVNDKTDRESYYKLNELLKDNPGYFSKWELNNIYVSCLKFLTYQNERYDNIFLNESYSLYEKLLNEFYKPEPALILQISFCRNYINLCRQKARYNRIREFHKKYLPHFPKGYEDDLLNLCESVYLFEKKNFSRSLIHASKVSVDRDIFKNDVKILKIKNFYELGYFESAFTELDNLKHLISASEKLNQTTVTKGKNFLKILLKLLKSRQGEKGTDIIQITNQIEKENIIYEKSWLLFKAKEIAGDK